MCKLGIELIILKIDFRDGISYCLLDDNKLPHVNIEEGQHPLECCSFLLVDYLELNPTWVSLLLVDLDLHNDYLSAYYTCIVPDTIKNLRGELVEVGRIEDEYIKKMVYQAIQRNASRIC